jgi:hypothetical protein
MMPCGLGRVYTVEMAIGMSVTNLQPRLSSYSVYMEWARDHDHHDQDKLPKAGSHRVKCTTAFTTCNLTVFYLPNRALKPVCRES